MERGAMQILLADDHELVRAGIRPFLAELAEDTEIIEAGSYDQALVQMQGGNTPDLAILDLRMPGGERGALAEFCRRFASVPVVVLSGSNTAEDILTALKAGAKGYVPKTFSGPALVHSLRLILEGERFFPACALEELLSLGGSFKNGSGGASATTTEGALLGRLSVRERDILEHMIQGGTNKEIARQLEVQEITVKVHLRNIYRKLGAANRAQAVRIALEDGWKTGICL
jgi:DNA-binding NarL/FixJ family response regulator